MKLRSMIILWLSALALVFSSCTNESVQAEDTPAAETPDAAGPAEAPPLEARAVPVLAEPPPYEEKLPPAPAISVPKPEGSKPNILFITMDSLRADSLGVAGNPVVKTPNLDSVARQGFWFSRVVTQFTQTNPSHAAMFTSTNELKHMGGDVLRESSPTLAELLQAAGYNTAGIYSFHGLDPLNSGLERGFRTYEGAYVRYPEQQDLWRVTDGIANVTTDAALGWLKNKDSDPFFLWVHYNDPHYPYAPPPPFDTMYSDCKTCLDGSFVTVDKIGAGEKLSDADAAHVKGLYYGEVSFTDREVGRLLDSMKSSGLLDNTMIILTADHGQALNEKGQWFHPGILTDNVLRVPLIISYPPAGATGVVDGVVRNVDLMPTILNLMGLPIPERAQGRSLWPVMLGQEKLDEREAFSEGTSGGLITAITTRDWKLIRNNVSGEIELYDLRTDPGEVRNLALANPEQAARLDERLRSWMASQGISPQR
ncbi:MAG: sulfatase-like hydrolase/transferase [Chloroflexi bacterium]|nr:sulfatase-like hydrolase/transferase [Chloroflexota bacterium]